MKNLDFRTMTMVKRKYFFFGHCSEDAIGALIDSAVEAGCAFEQIIMGMMPAPGSHLAIPGAQPRMIPIVRLFVSCLASEYDKVVAAVERQNGSAAR